MEFAINIVLNTYHEIEYFVCMSRIEIWCPFKYSLNYVSLLQIYRFSGYKLCFTIEKFTNLYSVRLTILSSFSPFKN